MIVKNRSLCILLLALFVGEMASAQEQTTNESGPHEVVFVCEHGAALSVVSAAFFNPGTGRGAEDSNCAGSAQTAA
jgi:hypothetical protein